MNQRRRASFFIRQLMKRYFNDNINQSAAELSYFLLFSVFPLIIFLNSLLSAFHVSISGLAPILEFMPRTLQTLVSQYFAYVASIPAASPMIIGSTLTLYFFSRVIRSLMRTVNRIFRVEVRRGPVREFALSVLFAVGFLVSLGGCLFVVVIGRTLLWRLPRWLPFLTDERIGSFLDTGYPLMTAFLFLYLLLFHRVVPNVRLKWREAAPGALFSLSAWLLVSLVFSFYVDHLGNYSALYGSLGAIIVLMLWLYLTSVAILLGALVNHILLVMRYLKRTGAMVSHDRP
ncbi:YihY/virulence factor BrkB family protein [Clostridiaceae bacterium]|nr:YihY/virulence factor BrkB family protein [Clostridiaceae bacterium]NBI81153.1 YihY/virulence factor BrkB family protein [Clostridiaceae bacterium]